MWLQTLESLNSSGSPESREQREGGERSRVGSSLPRHKGPVVWLLIFAAVALWEPGTFSTLALARPGDGAGWVRFPATPAEANLSELSLGPCRAAGKDEGLNESEHVIPKPWNPDSN